MLTLRPITMNDIDALAGTSYSYDNVDDIKSMISGSLSKTYNGRYYEFFLVLDGETVVGVMNVSAHSDHIISCGPEIKPEFRQKGYAFEAESMVLNMAKSKGFTIAVGGVQETNAASRALHEKLGFEHDRTYTNKRGYNICLYIKAL